MSRPNNYEVAGSPSAWVTTRDFSNKQARQRQKTGFSTKCHKYDPSKGARRRVTRVKGLAVDFGVGSGRLPLSNDTYIVTCAVLVIDRRHGFLQPISHG